MKKTITLLFTSVLFLVLLFSGCGKTFEGFKDDSSKNWEATKEGTKKAWDSTKKAINEATE